MAKPSHGVPPSLEIPRNIVLLLVIIVAMIPDPSCALVATSQGIKSMNVLKGRRGARGRPVAMVAQEVHYASMGQVVEVSPQASSLTRDTKKLRSIVIFQAPVVPSAWMANYHHQRQGVARQWLNLIKVSVPAVTSSGSPVYTSQFMTHTTSIEK
jgi:hypothetical protein